MAIWWIDIIELHCIVQLINQYYIWTMGRNYTLSAYKSFASSFPTTDGGQ